MSKYFLPILVLVSLESLYLISNFWFRDHLAMGISFAFILALTYNFIPFWKGIKLKLLALGIAIGIPLIIFLLNGPDGIKISFIGLKLFNFGIGLFFADLFRLRLLKITGFIFVLGVNFCFVPFVFIAANTDETLQAVFETLNSCDLRDKDSVPLHFEKGTVYLINFSFIGCMPCRNKHQALLDLKAHFQHEKGIRIIFLHGNEERENFSDFVRYSHDQYHDCGNRLSKKLKIHTYPTEIVIDKKGNIRRTSTSGGDLSEKPFYIYQSKKLLNALLHE